MRRRTVAMLMAGLLAALDTPAYAQESLSETLSFLLTTQAIPTGDFVKDEQSAEITRDTIGRLLLSELTTTPLSSSSGGFSYRFNPELGTVERASESFGPFYTERSLTVGTSRMSVGAQAQFARYSRLDSYNLRDGTFVTTANQFRDESRPFDVESLTLELNSTTVTMFGNIGLHDRIDLGLAVPFVRLSLDGTRLNVYRGRSLLQASATAEATGFGDIALRGKFNLFDRGGSGLAVIQEVRLPTGREEDLLGAGQMSFRTVFIVSSAAGPVEAHGNFGATLGGLSDSLDFRGAVTMNPVPRVTLVGELLGRHISDLGSLAQDRVPHPVLADVDTIRLISSGGGVNTAAFVVGTKWNISDTWLANVNLSLPLISRGLRSGLLVMFGVDYTFER